ncbi:hypothetical protein [Thiomicrorhabdus sp. Milos-T2]|uniref:hypothetical protein n=1 Tax=Thiomicrorhabdus sp. Milos-T2 TaxID=90814 RepID=UPI000494153E|nr:hypothetical protein [Thiomicrorhabdus sp. Milos-T2]
MKRSNKNLTNLLAFSLSFAFFSAQAATCEVPHATYGAKKSELAEKHSGTWVLLKDIKLTPNTIGYGPGGNTRFESTFYNNQAWLSSADELQLNGVFARHHYDKDVGNIFAVTATANSWREPQVLDSAGDVDELNMLLDEAVENLGCEEGALLPFRIKGVADSVKWSIESNPNKKVETYKNEPVELVGIYASTKRAEFFAMPNLNIHLHVIFPNRNFAAHVQQISLKSDSKLFFGQ